MKKVVLLVLFLLIIMVGCSKEKVEQDLSSPPELIEVTIQTPDTINLNEEVNIQASVTQGTDKVADANEVNFEIWKVGQEEREKIEATNDGDGIYSVNKTFTENGIYKVTAHVTARSMHSMPTKEFTVGSGEVETKEEVSQAPANDTSHQDKHENHHGEEAKELKIEANISDTMTLNKEINLKSTLTLNNEPLVGARVKYEIIPDGNKKEWLDAVEEGAGVYSAPVTFKLNGNYHLQIHVNKDEIHDHRLFMFQVK